MKQFVKSFFSKRNQKRIRSLINRSKSYAVSKDLNQLAIIWRTDKWSSHWYTKHYQNHFKQIRKNNLNILEIGIGGYDKLNEGGNSLRTWKYYFPRSNIYGIDIFDKKLLEEKRIKTFQGSQIDKFFLENVCKEIGNIDIIIDDGSHINDHIINSFKILFPLLTTNGIYVIEDLETSYWPDYGGDSIDLKNPKTSINFLKSLVDCLNYQEIIKPGYTPSYFDLNITEIHFYHNMVFIMKGNNDEKSVNIINNMKHRLD